jgi:Holliday junction resolvase RusA-like endonuclease
MGRAVRPDGDDLGAWFKAYIDGMADAGVVANDREIRWAADTINSDRGQVRRVEITIRPLTESEHG